MPLSLCIFKLCAAPPPFVLWKFNLPRFYNSGFILSTHDLDIKCEHYNPQLESIKEKIARIFRQSPFFSAPYIFAAKYSHSYSIYFKQKIQIISKINAWKNLFWSMFVETNYSYWLGTRLIESLPRTLIIYSLFLCNLTS